MSKSTGVTRDDSYDDAGQLTAIVYAKADGGAIGDLRYGYDAAGRLHAISAQSFSYDANGNLAGDGARTYVWNARNQLAQIKDAAGAVVASFGYDALGRRHSKTVDGVASGYLYDGANIVQELSGVNTSNAHAANVRANYLSGGVDEVFARWSGSGAGAKTITYLSDALGSVLRLTDGAGNKLVDYTYDPYGATTADAASANPFQYTGRENDGNGLYYYRARYYSPGLGRFVSSDPIGLAGGINTYAYVRGNPISSIDPLGLQAVLPPPIGPVPFPIVPAAAPAVSYPPPDFDPWRDTKTTTKVPSFPPSNGPKNERPSCQTMFANCMKGANICPTPIRQGMIGVCLAAYFVCQSTGQGDGP